jgi:SagB-type dehydrogenase family enzyme
MRRRWLDLYAPAPAREQVWETFHENSKTSPYEAPLSDEAAGAWLSRVSDSLPYPGRPAVKLPEELAPMPRPLAEVIRERRTHARLTERPLSMAELGAILHCCYGVNRETSAYRRPLRTIPSAGAVYPLEIFFHSRVVSGLPPGLYHYHPVRHEVSRVAEGDQTAKIASALIQKQYAVTTSMILLIGAMFERTTIKYGDRGYRFVLLEAGHAAQNICLAASALGLGCVPIGGYLDRRIDSLLGFDGLTQSVVYMTAVGGVPEEPAAPEATH